MFHSMKANGKIATAIFMIAIVICLILTSAGKTYLQPISSAGVPQLINYQGRLWDASGKPLGTPVALTKSLTFRFYAQPIDGAALWTETHQSVVVKEGVFSVLLGGVDSIQNPIPVSLFNNPNRYLEIVVDGKPMVPRQQITSVAFAFTAQTGPVTGNFGIGTASPASKLHVDAPSSEPQLMISNPTVEGSQVAGIRFHTGSGWDVQLRTRSNESWLELTDNAGGNVVHRWVGGNYIATGDVRARTVTAEGGINAEVFTGRVPISNVTGGTGGNFGGMYSTSQIFGQSDSCDPNPFTGGCSCPAGFNGKGIFSSPIMGPDQLGGLTVVGFQGLALCTR